MEKVNSLIKRAVSDIILLEHNHPSFQMISIIKADTAKDLSNARIHVSALKNEDDLIKYLNKLAPIIQKKLTKKVKLRTFPKLKFVLDTETEYLNNINRLIQKADKNK